MTDAEIHEASLRDEEMWRIENEILRLVPRNVLLTFYMQAIRTLPRGGDYEAALRRTVVKEREDHEERTAYWQRRRRERALEQGGDLVPLPPAPTQGEGAA